MTWPEDTFRPTAAPTPRRAPNLAVGYLLNVLLPGAGFTYIGLVGWHIGWIAILLVLNVLGAFLVGLTTSTVFGVLPLVGFVVMLVHFGRAYAGHKARRFRPVLDNGVKIGVIAGHFILNFALVGILAAVLIPNLLAARTRAISTSEQATARLAYTYTIAAQSAGTLRDGPCPLENLSTQGRFANVVSCTVMGAATTDPQVDVTFDTGHVVQLP